MVSSNGPKERKFSRRSFVGSVGALLAAGAIGIALKDVPAKAANPSTQAAVEEGSRPGYFTTRTRPITPVAKNSFSIFWITDTQFLSESNPALFRMATNWI